MRGPGTIPSSRESSSPRTERLRRTASAPAEGRAEQPVDDVHVGVDGLLGALPASGQPVGDRQQRHVHLDGFAGPQVAEDAPLGQRLGLVHEDNPHAGDGVPGPTRERAAARSCAASQDLAGELGCAQIVAEESHPPVGARVACERAWRRRGEALPSAGPCRASGRPRAAPRAAADFLPMLLADNRAGSACKARTRPSVSSVWP